MNTIKSRLNDLIAQNQTEQVIDELLGLRKEIRNYDLKEEIISVSASYRDYVKECGQGTLNHDEETLYRNRINARLQSIIRRLSKEEQKQIIDAVETYEPSEIKKEDGVLPRPKFIKWLMGALVVVALLIVSYFTYNGLSQHPSSQVMATLFSIQDQAIVSPESAGTLVLVHKSVEYAVTGKSLNTIIFDGLPATVNEDKISFILKPGAYRLDKPNEQYQWDGNPIQLKLRKVIPKPDTKPDEVETENRNPGPLDVSFNSRAIKGVVVDKISEEPISGASVSFGKYGILQATTDADGEFELTITKELKEASNRITAKAEDYEDGVYHFYTNTHRGGMIEIALNKEAGKMHL